MKKTSTIFIAGLAALIMTAYAPLAGAGGGHGGPFMTAQAEEDGAGRYDDKPATKQPKKGDYYSAKAWDYYNEGNVTKALEYFTYASVYPETAQEAKLGMGYCYLKDNRKEAALRIFKELAEDDFRVKEIMPTLMPLLLEKGLFVDARKYVERLEGQNKVFWTLQIDKGVVQEKFNKKLAQGDPNDVLALVQAHKDELRLCVMPDTFMKVAGFMKEKERNEESLDIYGTLLNACQDDKGIRIGVLYQLKGTLPYTDMRALVDKELKGAAGEYKAKLNELKLYLLKETLYATPSTSPLVSALAQEVLELDPEEESARVLLAWWNYHKEQFEDAYVNFNKLARMKPDNRDYALGLTYTLMKLRKMDEALLATERVKLDESDQDFMQLRQELYYAKALDSFGNGNYGESEKYLKKLLKIEPDNRTYETLLAWSLFNRGKSREALPFFLKFYKESKDADLARVILEIYKKEGIGKDEADFLETLAKSEEKELRLAAGDFYFRQGKPLQALKLCREEDTCYFNSDKPRAQASVDIKQKSGDEGFSKLSQISMTARYTHPFQEVNEAGFSVTPKYLASGDAPGNPFAGSFFRGGPPRNELETSLLVVEPNVEFRREGNSLLYLFQLGTTLGGVVSPRPYFNAQVGQNRWHINLHNTPVDQSILSYVGQQDPYSDEKWGGVASMGVEGEYVFVPMPYYWLSLKAGYDKYEGDNVIDNSAWLGNAAFGKTVPFNGFDLSAGAFALVKSYETNTNFFTFGHGGYFSPQDFFIIGPILSLKTKDCGKWRGEANFSLNYIKFKTDEVQKYPLSNDPSLANDRYASDSFSGIGYSAELSGLKLLNPYWAAGASFKLNKSADYTEWASSLVLRFFYEPRKGLAQGL